MSSRRTVRERKERLELNDAYEIRGRGRSLAGAGETTGRMFDARCARCRGKLFTVLCFGVGEHSLRLGAGMPCLFCFEQFLQQGVFRVVIERG